jgi:hypothetical protein
MLHKFKQIVKAQIDYWKYQITYFGPDHPRYRPAKIAKYEHLVRDFGELLAFLESIDSEKSVDNSASADQPAPYGMFTMPKRAVAESRHSPPAPPTPIEVIATVEEVPDDLSDLPPELLKELSESAKGETDQLITIINSRGGTANLDEILIDLWRKYKELGKRPLVSNKLYRLSRRGLCWSVPGKKGTYTTTKPANAPDDSDSDSEDDEGPDAATSGPSSEDMGAAGSPVGSPKSAPNGPTPFASTPIRRKLMSETSIPTNRLSFEPASRLPFEK